MQKRREGRGDMHENDLLYDSSESTGEENGGRRATATTMTGSFPTVLYLASGVLFGGRRLAIADSMAEMPGRQHGTA